MNQQDSEDFSAVHLAVGRDTDVKCLCRLVVDPHATLTQRLQSGSQPLNSAAARSDAERVSLVVDAGADITAENNKGRTTLHWAAEVENSDIVPALLELRADTTLLVDDDGLTAWDLMCLVDNRSQQNERAPEP